MYVDKSLIYVYGFDVPISIAYIRVWHEQWKRVKCGFSFRKYAFRTHTYTRTGKKVILKDKFMWKVKNITSHRLNVLILPYPLCYILSTLSDGENFFLYSEQIRSQSMPCTSFRLRQIIFGICQLMVIRDGRQPVVCNFSSYVIIWLSLAAIHVLPD